jgi:hypothetical protein
MRKQRTNLTGFEVPYFELASPLRWVQAILLIILQVVQQIDTAARGTEGNESRGTKQKKARV